MLHQFVVMETEGGWAMGKEDDEQFLRVELPKRAWRSWPSDVEDRDWVLISMLFVAHEREIRSANPPHSLMRIVAFFGKLLGCRL
jgi:hypothetical protein